MSRQLQMWGGGDLVEKSAPAKRPRPAPAKQWRVRARLPGTARDQWSTPSTYSVARDLAVQVKRAGGRAELEELTASNASHPDELVFPGDRR